MANADVPSATPARGRDIAVPAIGAIAALLVLAAHAASYFFLLDDLIITRQVSSHSVWTLLSQPQFNFYRPVSDLWLKALFALFAWNKPVAYITGSLVVHAASAVLVRVIAGRCGLERGSAMFAGVLFLVSPWATEPILWVAASCDSLPTLGLLGCVIAGLALTANDGGALSPRGWGVFGLGVACAAWALLAKETGVLGPALVALAITAMRGTRALRQPRVAVFVLVIGAAAAAYLLVRQAILPGLGGGYGTLSTLFGRSSILKNLYGFAVTLLGVPLPDLTGAGGVMVRIAGIVFAAGVTALVLMGAVSRRRLALLCVAAAMLGIAPVLWATLVPGNTSGNRFLYLPGVWIAILAAAGVERLNVRVRPAVAAVILAIAVTSLYHQTRVWKEAFRLSRTTIDQMRPYENSTSPLFITNLPGLFADGPYVLNGLAVTSYFGGSLPPLDNNWMGLKYQGGAATFAFWLTERRDPRAGERPVTLDLPVWTAESRPFGGIDVPAAGAVVTQPFAIRGWTIDAGAREGTGVDTVRVYAYRIPDGDAEPTPLGSATYGEPRPDVAGRFGERFLASGFELQVSGLRPGRYRLSVSTRRPLARGAAVPLSVDVEVR